MKWVKDISNKYVTRPYVLPKLPHLLPREVDENLRSPKAQ